MADLQNTPSANTLAEAQIVPKSGDVLIDGLLWGTALGSEVDGVQTTISYSFAEPGSVFSNSSNGYSAHDAEPWNGMKKLSPSQIETFQSILTQVSQQTNVDFHYVEETPSEVGTIRIAWTDHVEHDHSAWAYFPAETSRAGDIWLNNALLSPDRSDQFFSFLLTHELAHSLGLKHPDDHRQALTHFPGSLDSVEHTIMSYNPLAEEPSAVITNLWPQTLMAYDIAALEYLYGPNTTSAGNDTYSYDTASRYYETISDIGGEDTLSFSGFSNLSINLSPGTWSNIGTKVHYWDDNRKLLPIVKTDTLFLTDKTIIEHVVTDKGNDVIEGNRANNHIHSGSGSDTVSGHDGNDHIVGGNGHDFITGNSGVDTLSGGSGNDRIFAGSADNEDDLIIGGSDNDILGGGPGNDLIIGGNVSGTAVTEGLPKPLSDKDHDIFYGSTGNDTLVAGNWENGIGNQTFEYGEHTPEHTGTNQMWAGDGHDLLIGANGHDQLGGNKGDDRLIGEGGNDTLWGGAGSDTFVFSSGHGHDYVADFDINNDLLDISGLIDSADIISNASASSQNSTVGILITTSQDSSIFLANISMSALLNISVIYQ